MRDVFERMATAIIPTVVIHVALATGDEFRATAQTANPAVTGKARLRKAPAFE
jgi:hypothetical protein